MKKLLFILSFLAGITQVYCHTSNDGFQYNGVWNETYNHIVIEGDSAANTYIIYMADAIKRKDFRGWGCAGDLLILNNSDSCSAQFISTGAGKGRLYYNYDDNPSDSCNCGIKSISLDVYKHFNPTLSPYDMEISGPDCILQGDTVVYSIYPLLTKNLNSGIGVDGYYWNVADTTPENKLPFVDKVIYNAGDGSSVTFIAGEITGNETIGVRVGLANSDNLLYKTLGKSAPKPTIASRCIEHGEANVLFTVSDPQPNVQYNWTCSDDTWAIDVNPLHTDTAYISPENDASANITVLAYYEGNEHCSASYTTIKVGRKWNPNAQIVLANSSIHPPYEMQKEYTFKLEGAAGGGLNWKAPKGWLLISKPNTGATGYTATFKPANSDSVLMYDVLRVEAKTMCSSEVQYAEMPVYVKPAKVRSITDTACITPNSTHTFTINSWGEGPQAISYQWKIYAGTNCLKDTITNNLALTIYATPNMTNVVVTPIGASDGTTQYNGDSNTFLLTFSPEKPVDVQASKSCIAYNMPDEVILTVQETDTTQSYGWNIPTPLNLNSYNQRKNQVAIGTNGQEGSYIVKVWGLGSGLCGTSDTIQHIIEIEEDNATIQYVYYYIPAPVNFLYEAYIVNNTSYTALSYDWYFFDDGNIVDGLDSNTGTSVYFKGTYTGLHDIRNSQQYGLVCIVTYADGCHKTLVKYGAVPESLTFPLVHAPVSSPARQRSNNMNNSHSDVFLHPNPTNNELIINITTHSDEVSELYVVDVMGNMVLSNQSFIIGTSCEVSSLPHGQYFVCIKVGEDSYVKPFIKQ